MAKQENSSPISRGIILDITAWRWTNFLFIAVNGRAVVYSARIAGRSAGVRFYSFLDIPQKKLLENYWKSIYSVPIKGKYRAKSRLTSCSGIGL